MSEASVDAEVAIMKRAFEITTPAEWIRFFEWFTFARLFKVTVLLVFGTAVFNVDAVFGGGFEPYVSTATYWVLAVKLEDGKSWSAVRPESHLIDVNDFEIAVPFKGPSGLVAMPVDLTVPLPPSILPYRQSAGAAARDINLSRKPTEAAGECGIDTMCFHRGIQRSCLHWQQLRETLAAEMILNSSSLLWQAAFFGMR